MDSEPTDLVLSAARERFYVPYANMSKERLINAFGCAEMAA
jgi:hypothetical protein